MGLSIPTFRCFVHSMPEAICWNQPENFWNQWTMGTQIDTLATLFYGDQRLVELAFALASKPKVDAAG